MPEAADCTRMSINELFMKQINRQLQSYTGCACTLAGHTVTVGYVLLCFQCYDKLSYTVQVSDILPLWAVESSYKILNVMSLDKLSSGVQFSCIFCTLKCNSNKFNRSILLYY